MISIKHLLIGCLITAIGVAGAVVAIPGQTNAAACAHGDFLGFPSWTRGLECEGDAGKGTVHVVVASIPQTIWTVALNILDILLRVVGIVAVAMILVSAFKYLTNGGNEQKIASAKTSLMQAVVGLLIALVASTIIGFIMAGLTGR